MATAVQPSKVDPSKISMTRMSENEDEKRRVLEIADRPEGRRQRARLAAAYRMIARAGMDDGVAGHISLRVPGAPDYFWVNHFGLFFNEIRADNLVLVNKQGEIVHNGRLINYAGFCIHSAIHAARPDVNCALHTHPPQGSAFSALHQLLRPLDQVGCSFFEDHALYSEYDGIIIDPKQADGIVDALGDKRALILANHGLLTAAGSVEQAVADMLDLERTCGVNLRAMATGQPLHDVPTEFARQARAVQTQPGRWPFQWTALIRDLRRHETDWDPYSWHDLAT